MHLKGSIALSTVNRLNLQTLQRGLAFSAALKWKKFENERFYIPGEDVFARVWHGLTYDSRRWARRLDEARRDAFKRRHPIAHAKKEVQDHELIPFRTDFLVIGGGLTGSSVAFWLKQRFRDEDLRVVVIEDPDKFANTKSILSTGELTQQFALPELVDMGIFSAEFMRHAGEHLQVLDSETPDLNFFPVGFMHMAKGSEDTEKLRDAWKMQVSKGVKVAFYNQEEARQKFPFINFDGISAVTYGLENEGFFDPWQLLAALREKNITLGVLYVQGEVEGFRFHKDPRFSDAVGIEEDIKSRRMSGVYFKPKMSGSSARPIETYQVINCAGPWTGQICEMAGIGKGTGVLSVPVPIKLRKRTYFILHAPDVPALHMPALRDPSGIFCRPYEPGQTFICGRVPTKEEDRLIDHSNMEVDYNEFHQRIWPVLCHRVPSFKSAQVMNAWSAPEDVNIFDDAPIMGEHLLYQTFYTMGGFSNYGAQMSLAAGKLYSERALDYAYSLVNVRRFDLRRIMMVEYCYYFQMDVPVISKFATAYDSGCPNINRANMVLVTNFVNNSARLERIKLEQPSELHAIKAADELPEFVRRMEAEGVQLLVYVDSFAKNDPKNMHETIKQLQEGCRMRIQHVQYKSVCRQGCADNVRKAVVSSLKKMGYPTVS
ncbi:putative fad oxidoreductase [Aphelenchoides bicaudatus]|nr:putative fad oxidoreductase [Aphelenchoides bicaudatus]